jgi:peptidoglycan/LPS O-acetylase OafA/YrhL
VVKDLGVHLFFLNNYLDPLPNGPTWFLAATVHFYLVVPILFALLYKWFGDRFLKNFLKIILGLASLSIGLRVGILFFGTHADNDFMLTHLRLDAIFIGVGSSYLLKQNHPVVSWLSRHSAGSTLVALLFIAPAMFLSRINPFMFTAGFVLLACGYATLIILIANGALKLDQKWLGSLRAIAVWSYNIYLWHYFLPVLLGHPFQVMQEGVHRIFPAANVEAAVQIVLFIAVSIVAGYIVTRGGEQPMSRLLLRKDKSTR